MERNDRWLNSTVLGAGITSFLSDMSHEAVTVLLPSFMMLIGAPIYALGVIEGISDGASSFTKLLSGHYADRTRRRKELALYGYITTAIFPFLLAVANSWPVVLTGRFVGWVGRGLRGPPRDAILASAVDARHLGKAFGFHRAGDTLGAIAGPLIALSLLGTFGVRGIFWLALVPGCLAVIAFWLLVKEPAMQMHGERRTLMASIKEFPLNFRYFLSAVFVFGIADFSHTLLIAFAIARLTPVMGFLSATAAGASLYVIRNVAYAIMSYPFGALGDRFGRRGVLAAGYSLAIFAFAGFILFPPDPIAYALLFSICGAFIAAEDTLESAVAAELVQERTQATAFGVLATVNGVGDLISSLAIGFIWAIAGYTTGFLFAMVLATVGTILLLRTFLRGDSQLHRGLDI